MTVFAQYFVLLPIAFLSLWPEGAASQPVVPPVPAIWSADSVDAAQWRTGFGKGYAHAIAQMGGGQRVLLTGSYFDAYFPEWAAFVSRHYGIELRHIVGCEVEAADDGYIEGYNAAMGSAIDAIVDRKQLLNPPAETRTEVVRRMLNERDVETLASLMSEPDFTVVVQIKELGWSGPIRSERVSASEEEREYHRRYSPPGTHTRLTMHFKDGVLKGYALMME